MRPDEGNGRAGGSEGDLERSSGKKPEEATDPVAIPSKRNREGWRWALGILYGVISTDQASTSAIERGFGLGAEGWKLAAADQCQRQISVGPEPVEVGT